MITAVNRPAALHIDVAAIRENTVNAKKHLKPGQKLFCVVKANAYGHGAVALAPVMEEAGADGFCVAMLDEGLELRRAQSTWPSTPAWGGSASAKTKTSSESTTT